MLHFALFGDNEGELPTGNLIAFTLCGNCKLRRATLAQRLLAIRRRGGKEPGFWERLFEFDSNILVTLLGGTEVTAPSLIEEYSDLRRIVMSGAIGPQEARQLLQQMMETGRNRDFYTAFTIMGSLKIVSPRPEHEREALRKGCESGIISEEERRELDAAIGRPTSVVAEVLDRLVLTPA